MTNYEIIKEKITEKPYKNVYKVWKTTHIDNGFNIKCVFKALSRKECQEWLKGQKNK